MGSGSIYWVSESSLVTDSSVVAAGCIEVERAEANGRVIVSSGVPLHSMNRHVTATVARRKGVVPYSYIPKAGCVREERGNPHRGVLLAGGVVIECLVTYGCVETKADVVDERVVTEKGVIREVAAFLEDRPRLRR